MKRKISMLVLLVLTFLLLCTSLCLAESISTIGPSKTDRGASKSKQSSSAEPKLNISSLSIGGTGEYIFWVRHDKEDSQVTGTYYFTKSTTGNRNVYYLQEKRVDGEVVAGDKNTPSFKSNKKVPASDKGSCSFTFTP